jgi:hypothetical protein
MDFKQWSKRDKIILFLLVPLILFLIYLLPSNIKDAYFVLHKNNISILNMFLSNYTHSNFEHLLGNLIGYLITICLIMKFETNKASFYKTMGFLFLILPFIVSTITTIYVPALNSQGFSGIVCGLNGYFIYVIYRYLQNKWKLNANISFVILIFYINGLLGTGDYLLKNNPLKLIVILIILIILSWYNLNLFRGIINFLKNKKKEFRPQNFLLILKDFFIFIFTMIFLFSLPLLIQFTAENGNITNIFGHYFGYLGGMLFPIIFIEILKRNTNKAI